MNAPYRVTIGVLLMASTHACAHPNRRAAASDSPPASDAAPRTALRASLLDTRAALGVPTVDLAGDSTLPIVVDREPGQYLGHPTTVLLEDGHTMLAVYPRGHGEGAVQLKRSVNGGRTWSARLPVPDNWSTSKETPTIYRTIDRAGVKRLIMFSGLYPIRLSVSSDDGNHWSPLEPIGRFGGIVAMASLVRLKNGDYMALFHDDGRFITNSGKRGVFVVYKTLSHDGGLHWEEPVAIASRPDIDLCEPGAFRSPDGKRIVVLLRENRRTQPSQFISSDDEGVSWSAPRPVSSALTGDRHVVAYLPDGRLFATFRDMAPNSPSKGDWVAWIGTFDELTSGISAGFRVRLMDNTDAWDSSYPGLVLLRDGTIVTTTYGHWTANQPPWIATVRLNPRALDDALTSLTSRPH